MRCTDCGCTVKPVVVSDIDGTLADYYTEFSIFAAIYHDRPVVDIDAWDGTGEMEAFLGLTKAEYREAKLAYRQGGNKRLLAPYPFAREFAEGVVNLGCELWVATTRPWQRLDNIDPDTKEWLRRNGIPYHGLLYGDDKYKQLCEHVDAARVLLVVDDLPEQLEVASSLGLPFFQVARSHNAGGFLRWRPSGTLADALQIVRLKKEQWDANR